MEGRGQTKGRVSFYGTIDSRVRSPARFFFFFSSLCPPLQNKLAEVKQYKTNPKMSSISSTNNGYIAVGADDGQIRLYDSISKVAKTCLPGLGDAIVGLDVTADGSYVLATTKHYLLVIPTSVAGQEKSGFKQSITNKANPPIKLQLDPSDCAMHNIKELNFTPARFNVGEGQEEFISTSTGQFIVMWNFTAIKQGRRFRYKIKTSDSSDAHAHQPDAAELSSLC